MKEIFDKMLIESLKEKGIDIYAPNYKESEAYRKMKPEFISTLDGTMSTEEYIERFILPTNSATETYDSKYEMGNPFKLAECDCNYTSLMKEIMIIGGIMDDYFKAKEKDHGAKDESIMFTRPNGYIDQLKKHLKLDLAAEHSDLMYQTEKFKILYFVYMLKHRFFPKTEVLGLFSKPSMENIDNSQLRWITSNGDVVGFIKNTLVKELSLPTYGMIRHEIDYKIKFILSLWDSLIEGVQESIYRLDEEDCRSFFERCTRAVTSLPPYVVQEDNGAVHSPMAMLYLKVLQHEYIGNVLDIKRYINNTQPVESCSMPPELVAEMKALARNPVDLDDLFGYIKVNASRIDKFVYYTKAKPTKEDRRRMKDHIWKIAIIVELCKRARPLVSRSELSNELFIVSCLQTILVDRESGKFNYTFYGHQRDDANKIPNIPSIPRAEDSIVDAAKVYWSRKVSNRWDANVGIYEARKPIRIFENECDKILLKILEQPTIDEMVAMHSYYMQKIQETLDSAYPSIDIGQIGRDRHGSGFKKIRK